MTAADASQTGYYSVKKLENILDTCKLELSPVDEVWPHLYVGNVTMSLTERLRLRRRATAQNRAALQELGITHVLNAAHSKQGSLGDQHFYGSSFAYYGVPAEDSSHFDLSTYFRPAARFIHKALKKRDGENRALLPFALSTATLTGKVLVHCIVGMSRSATLVLAYLMLYHRLTLTDAIEKVIQKRAIYPNRNFLALLLDLDTRLRRKRRICPLL